ncbi:MAG: hypothetical protein H0U95_10480 [Bacteroidetes bacterium]|nr:hypothetical protein [Bacteroidota bacterium]
MNQELKQEEREVIKLVVFFKKKAETWSAETEIPQEFKQLMETCDKLVEQINIHAQSRELILSERELLKKLVKDNAQCPRCNKNENLKLIGTEKNEKDWQSNKYKCRKCNITFVWNAPNNPWDMIPYVESVVAEIEKKAEANDLDDATKQHFIESIAQMKSNLEKLKPVVENSAADIANLELRDKEMAEIVHKFKKHLMIEKIKLED